MSLNIDGSDISDIGGSGGGSPAQDAKILVLEDKTQNIDATLTDGTKTEFINKIVANEMSTPLSTAVKYRSSQYYDNAGIAGFFMTAGATGTIQINKTPYQGTADAIMSLSTNGTIQKSTLTTNNLPVNNIYNLTISDLVGSGALRDEWLVTNVEQKIFIQQIGAEKIANFFISYTRTLPSLVEVKLDATTNNTVSVEKNVNFRDSGGLPSDYQSSELYNITFDAGIGNSWEMTVNTCEFEHSGSGQMYDRLGIQESSDNITYANVSIPDFYTSVTPTPYWSTSRASTTNGYIFPPTESGIQNLKILIQSRYIKFYFTSDGSSNRNGWDVALVADDAFNGSLILKDCNTTANTQYKINNGYVENNGSDLDIRYNFDPSLKVDITGSIPLTYSSLPTGWS